jgi:hypothetical protein
MLEQLLANEQVINGIVGVVGLLLTLLVGWLTNYVRIYIKNEKVASQINGLVEDAVFKTFDTYVKEIKTASADGKLTKAERAIAFDKARGYLMTDAKKKGIDVTKTIAEDKIKQLLEGAVQRSKMGGFKVNGVTIADRIKERK